MEQLIFLVNEFGEFAKVCIARMQDSTLDEAILHGNRNIEMWKRMYPNTHTFAVISVEDNTAVEPPKA